MSKSGYIRDSNGDESAITAALLMKNMTMNTTWLFESLDPKKSMTWLSHAGNRGADLSSMFLSPRCIGGCLCACATISIQGPAGCLQCSVPPPLAPRDSQRCA